MVTTGNSNSYGNPELDFYICTFGFPRDVRDSGVICGLLQKEGYRLTDEPGSADIILFNTCSVRQHAEDKVWSEIGKLKQKMGTLLRGHR